MVNPPPFNEQEKAAVVLSFLLQQLQPTHCHLLQALERFDYGELGVSSWCTLPKYSWLHFHLLGQKYCHQWIQSLTII